MSERDSLAGIFFEIDQTIARYLQSNEIVERECGYSRGHLKAGAKTEYETRRRAVRRDYEENCLKLVDRLDHATAKLPAAENFCERYLAAPPKFFRRHIVAGELSIRYANFERRLPLTWRLPLSRPLCVADKDARALPQIMFRLLFTLPPGLCRFHVYDPCHFGNSVDRFDILRDVEQLFPDKNFLCNEKDFKALLDELSADFAHMRQELFPAQNCRTWSEFNRKMRIFNLPRKQLPYKVLVCFDLPELCTAELLTALKRLADEGARFGFLLLFSFRPEALSERKNFFDGSVEAYKNDRTFAALKAIHKNSVPLENSFSRLNELSGLKFLQVTENFSPPLEPHVMEKFLRLWREMLLTKSDKPIAFDELIGAGKFFDATAIDGLQIPLGLDLKSGDVLKLPVCDLPPHTLIAGATGSGKSNLLHVLICNACVRYSPAELNLYLLDFKDGVEFATYAAPPLPHAKLVATQADAFHAQTVLEHLGSEISRRNELFKKFSCSNYREFRKKNSAALPRIILIIDEFQRLFEADAKHVMEVLKFLAKQGRSAGVHLIFATQTFKGIGENNFAGSFSQLKGQFGARLALRCSVDDSKDILGQSNEAAADLTLGFAILNTGSGVKDNRKFAVPEAAEAVKVTIQTLAKISAGKSVQTKIFNGQTLPPFPTDAEFFCDAPKILLGRRLSYESESFFVDLSDKPEQNLLFCGQVESFFSCTLKFAGATKFFDERVYIGRTPPENFIAFATPQDFFDAVKDSPVDRRRLIILDACEFPKPSFSPKPSEAAFFNFWQDLSEHGSHVLAFYETFNRLKASNLDYAKLFAHRVARKLLPSQIQLLGNVQLPNGFDDNFKAAYLYSERVTWFQPFAEN